MTAGSSSRTYGFLFADLRGFTEFVETHGDREAGALLAVFRPLVRSVLAAYDDAEVRTEGAEARTQGDSFYLRFPSVGAAVTCGLEITRAAEEATRARPDRPIRVGVGIHAGETIETDEGLVGSAVNVAARVCSLAKAGEVLVTDTVRSLTRTSLDVSFQPRGTPYLKGVAEPIPLFVVQSGATYPSSTAGTRTQPVQGTCAPSGCRTAATSSDRDALTSRLVERLEQVSRVGRLLAVVGPSGSGKSSVVRAGLLPAVGDGVLAGSQDWRIAVMFPGAHPFDELAAALGAVQPVDRYPASPRACRAMATSAAPSTTPCLGRTRACCWSSTSSRSCSPSSATMPPGAASLTPCVTPWRKSEGDSSRSSRSARTSSIVRCSCRTSASSCEQASRRSRR